MADDWPTWDEDSILPAGVAEPAFRATLQALLDQAGKHAARLEELAGGDSSSACIWLAFADRLQADLLANLIGWYDERHVDRSVVRPKDGA